MKVHPEDTEEPLSSLGTRHPEARLALCAGFGLTAAAVLALALAYGTRSGRVDKLTQLPSRTLAARLPALPATLRNLPFTGSISWRYTPLRREWFLSGPADIRRLERYFADQGANISVTRSDAGYGFTVARPDLRTTGTFDSTGRILTLVSTAEHPSSRWTPAPALAEVAGKTSHLLTE